MKTLSDLKALIPELTSHLISQKHEIGAWYVDTDMDEDGDRGCIVSTPAVNDFAYEEDGWLVEGDYECIGKLDSEGCISSPEGHFISLSAYHYDEDTGEETTFSECDLTPVCEALDVALNESL